MNLYDLSKPELVEKVQNLEEQVSALQRAREMDYHKSGKTSFQMIRDFHDKFGLEIRHSPIDFSYENDENTNLFTLRNNLHKEEWEELLEAWEGEDLVKFVDAVCDLHYVTVGTLVSFGVDFDKCFAEVHRSNMSKLDLRGNPIVRPDDGKILKGPNFSEPDLRSIIYGVKNDL